MTATAGSVDGLPGGAGYATRPGEPAFPGREKLEETPCFVRPGRISQQEFPRGLQDVSGREEEVAKCFLERPSQPPRAAASLQQET